MYMYYLPFTNLIIGNKKVVLCHEDSDAVLVNKRDSSIEVNENIMNQAGIVLISHIIFISCMHYIDYLFTIIVIFIINCLI